MGNRIILDKMSPEIQYLCQNDVFLCNIINKIGILEYDINDNPYEFLVHEIIEQMLSQKAGCKIFQRLVNLCNGNISPEVIAELSDEDIKSIGTSNSKVSYIRNITNAVLSQDINFNDLYDMDDNEVFKKLTSIKGVGKWTANMYLIFVFNRKDILPTNDAAFLQAYKWLYRTDDVSEKSIREKCKIWKPYSSIAARYLYIALDTGLVKKKDD